MVDSSVLNYYVNCATIFVYCVRDGISRIFFSVPRVWGTIAGVIRVDGPRPNKQMLVKGACESQQCRGKAENTARTPSIFNLVPLLSQRVLFNGEGGNRTRTRRPMVGRLEIIHGIAGRAAASESGGEVRFDEVMLVPRVSLTFDGPVPTRHCSHKRWGSLSSIGVRYFFSFFGHLLFLLFLLLLRALLLFFLSQPNVFDIFRLFRTRQCHQHFAFR